MASSAWGEIRTTNDVDFAVLLADDEAEALAGAFTFPYHASLESIRSAIAHQGEYRSTHAMHEEESFTIDLFLVRPDPYTLTEFRRARRVEVLEGRSVPFYAPENIVLQKPRWYEAGNRVSDRQGNDIVRALDTQRETLDYPYLRLWAGVLGVDELLGQAFDERRSDDPFA